MNTQSKATRGGARKGAGRKPGRSNIRLMFSIPITTAEALKAIPLGERSKFVNQAIEKALHN